MGSNCEKARPSKAVRGEKGAKEVISEIKLDHMGYLNRFRLSSKEAENLGRLCPLVSSSVIISLCIFDWIREGRRRESARSRGQTNVIYLLFFLIFFWLGSLGEYKIIKLMIYFFNAT